MNSSYVYSREELISQFARLNVPCGKPVLVHSSLKLVGEVEGGGEGLLDAMIEFFTKDGGLLCIPTHTWGNLDKDITLDMNDPKTCLGALSDIAAADARGIRSQNPTHSMVVFGDRDRANEFVKDDEMTRSGTAPESAYGKLYRDGGYVLLVGVSHNRNTYLHCVDEMLGAPNRMSDKPRTVAVKLKSGEVITREYIPYHTDYTGDISLRFHKYETAFRYHGAITDGFIGNAPTQACDARTMKNVVELIRDRGNGEDPLKSEFVILPKLYC